MALLPIGGVFTMDALQASEAAKIINPKIVIPIHYRSFPIIAQSADDFVKHCLDKAPRIKVVPLEPGKKISV